jgi:hypothetical protein
MGHQTPIQTLQEMNAMKFRIALVAAASLALAACGSSQDASTGAEADSVEVDADNSLQGVDATPVPDADATSTAEPTDEASATSEAQQIQDAGDKAADTAAQAMDALSEDSNGTDKK